MQLQNLTEKVSLAGLLRTVGALTVVAAMCAHLLEGWHAWNDLSRYYVMLGGTVLLALAGAVMGYWSRDVKSARAFFSLGLISVVANMTTLGGLVHSQLNGDPVFAAGGLAALAAGSIFLVLLPAAWFAFKVLARSHATNLLGIFAASSALLLFPFRESLGVGLVIAAALALPALYLRRRVGDVAFRTLEGRIAAAALFAPALVMLGRLLWLYQADELVTLILAGIGFFATRYAAVMIPRASGWHAANNVSSVLLALVIGITAILLGDGLMPDEALLPLFSVVFGGLVWSMGLQCEDTRDRFAYAGAYSAVSFTLANLIFTAGDGGLGCLVVGLLVALGGRLQRLRGVMAAGMVTAGLGLLPSAFELAGMIDLTNWLTLAIIGFAVMVLASVCERLLKQPLEDG